MPYKFRYEEACSTCGQPTHEACDVCGKVFCGGGRCLFQSGKMLTFPPDPQDEYPSERSRAEELCLACYLQVKKQPPLVLWQDTGMESFLRFGDAIRKGISIPAGMICIAG